MFVFYPFELGCMAHSYKSADVTTCLSSKQVVFIGDSVTRQLFFHFAKLVDAKLPDAPPDDESKHQNYTLNPDNGVGLSFYWDPYMNSSHAKFIHANGNDRTMSFSDRPALLVIGTGLWYLRYSDSSGGLPAWESRVESVLDIISHASPKLADSIVILPIEEPISWKLTPERASTIHRSDVDAMNSDLYHRIYPSTEFPFNFLSPNPSSFFPLVFNDMLDPSQTEDGLHFSKAVVKAQANLLLNLHCNDELPKKYPFDKTCCRNYPWPSRIQALVNALLIFWGPGLWFSSWRQGSFR
jgi:N-acetylneuraminate 9-O-acetyltransferase